MSDNIARIGRRVQNLKVAPEFDGYSKVVVVVNEDLEYTAGVDGGRTLKVECPWAAPGIAQKILDSIHGFQYQPYSAQGAILDPAAEIGDGVTVNNIYSGLYRRKTIFGRDFRTDMSAPGEEEIDHEFPYVPAQDRKITRKINGLSSEMKIQAGLIAAKVSRTGGDDSSFGWELNDSSWIIKANGTDVLKATKSGLEIYGKVTATSGKIGGFSIENNALSTNSQTFNGTNTTGIYIGPSGLRLGKNFSVDSAGNLTASSGKFTGNVSAGSIDYGGLDGYFSGGGISSGSIYNSRIADYTISSLKVNGGINTSLGYANFSDSVFNGYDRADYIDTKVLMVKGTQFAKKTISFRDYYGNTRTFYVLAVVEE